MTAREKAIQTAASFKGQRDTVVTTFNSYLPHPRGYKVKDSDLLCASYTSSVFIALNWTQLVPPECAAWRLYRNMEAIGCSHWGNDVTPNPGDLIFFGVGDSVSKIDHVGIVDHVDRSTIYFWDIRSTVMLHSYKPGAKSSVKAYGYILGYGFPDYASVEDGEPEPAPYEFKVGDLVTINPGAKWYKGQSIKLSCISDKWYISSIKGDRAVLGMNLAETRCIQSPIHTSDITLVVATEPVEPKPNEKVSITVDVDKETYQLLQIMAQGAHKTMGEIIDLLLEDAR